jgi:electron transfer flavoprotein beta subunit
MNIVVPVRLVPDLVEEIEIDETGTGLDTTWLRLIINEFDDHAIEQAILLAEASGGKVTIVAPEAEGVDDVLYAAAAKGAEQVVKLAGDFETGANSHALARALAGIVEQFQPDLVLTGVQAHDDLDGSVGGLLAGYLDMPYVGYVAGLAVDNGRATVQKEYPGGLVAEMDVALPAVLGVQAAEQPPRYVPISKIRQAMKSVDIHEEVVAGLDSSGGPTVSQMSQAESGQRARMLEGDEEEIAAKLIGLFRELGVL